MASQPIKKTLAESARYALLRRLTPMLSHNMAGVLQPLSMISTLLEKRLQNPHPDYAALVSKSSQLKTLAREASLACIDLMTWLEPHNNEFITVAEGIEEVIEMLRTELSVKGFLIANQTGNVQTELPRSLMRNVFLAALMALTDAAITCATVVLAAQLVDKELILTISLQSSQEKLLQDGLLSYRKIEWTDVQALAEILCVRLTCNTDRVTLHCPLNS